MCFNKMASELLNAQTSDKLLLNEKTLSDTVINDSGHESSGSLSAELPSTPEGEQKQHDAFTNTVEEKLSSSDSNETKFFRIKIAVPGGENIEVQISDGDIVQELYQMLLEKDSTCHRTCFRLYYEGNPLDQFTEIKNIPNIQDQVVFTVVEEPYNIREARTHVRHLREIVRSHDISDAANGVEFASFTCLSQITQAVDENRKSARPPLSSSSAEIRSESDCLPPYWLLPGCGEVPLKPLIPLNSNYKSNGNESLTPNSFQAIRQIYFSSFNPPPGPRKIKGDVLYLVVDCVEERRFHITCCTRGFFVNSSVGDVFKPEKSSVYGNRIYHSLFDLLSDLSPHFKKTFSQILKTRADKHIFERLPAPYQLYHWIVPLVDNKLDQMRADDQIQPFRVGFEDHMPGQIRDWNEELQTTHDMPQTTFAERLCRDRARFKVNADFLQACVRGALAVIDGSVLSINPSDEPKMQMFIWNNIFLSLGFDEIGGDAAAHASYSADLAAVQAYAHIDDPKLHTCGMAVIDLRGCRIMAQSIIPGILDREQHEPIVYGSFDSGKTVLSNDVYAQLLQNSSELLKIQPHLVWNGKEGDEYVKLFSSYESKGIIGNDRRHYLMDLLRTFPPDVNFLEDAEPTEKAKALGFPRKFPHKLVYLRQELVDTFVDAKVYENRKSVNSAKNKENVENKTDGEVKNDKDADVKSDELKEESKLKEEKPLVIRLNPDCYSTAVKHHPDEDLEGQRKLVAEAAEFLLFNQIPQFVNDCIHLASAPADGVALTEALHNRGINMRYLGKVIEALEINKKLGYLVRIAKVELLCRSIRHIFREFIRSVEAHCIGMAVAHFLNCFIGGSEKNVLAMQDTENNNNINGNAHSTLQKKIVSGGKKKRRMGEKNNNNNSTLGNGSTPIQKSSAWTKLTQETLWKAISDESDGHYNYRIVADCCDSFIEWSDGARRSAIIRRFCAMNGVQIVLKNYQFESKSQTPFSEDDIFNLVPVVKHLNPRSQMAYNFYLNALIKMQQGFPRIGYELMQQAHSMMLSIYGPLHSDLALCLRFMARMAYAMNDYPDALAQQHRALLISERCNGIDHHETISDYINLAHFSFANLCITSSLKLFYRARHLLLLACGEDHPQIGQIDANIGVILYLLQEYDTSMKFLNNALSLYQKYGVSMKTALLTHVISRVHSCRGDFRTALTFEKETFNVYSNVFGNEHEKTVISSERLRQLTNQAVTLQKHMNEATSGLKTKQLMPKIQIQPPTLQNIIELLNAFNNFLFWKVKIQTE
uniref:Clu domain-containing protein n=1 Tax=Meloidogyne enterolobii TaxID=390850 RepID=A0A6V7UBT4_MELEN|nr:unnamed protein product [Meloidogyne enterolobii]